MDKNIKGLITFIISYILILIIFAGFILATYLCGAMVTDDNSFYLWLGAIIMFVLFQFISVFILALYSLKHNKNKYVQKLFTTISYPLSIFIILSVMNFFIVHCNSIDDKIFFFYYAAGFARNFLPIVFVALVNIIFLKKRLANYFNMYYIHKKLK